MKVITLGVLSAAALAFSIHTAPAADSSAYMALCEEGSKSDQLPPNVTAKDMVDFCTCMVDEVGDNQDAIDEMTQMSEEISKGSTPEERQKIAQESGPPSQLVQTAFQACAGPPPQQ